MKNIVIVAHKYLTQPDDELVLYLNKKRKQNVLHIYHSFIEASDRKSYAVWYRNGEELKRLQSLDYKVFPEPFIYLKELICTIRWIITSGAIWDCYIGMDGLCVLFGNLLKAFSRVRKTVYWAIDFVPEDRFPSGFKNKVYHTINTWGYKKSDEMWDLSPRMKEAREKYLGIKQSDYKSQKIVPYGMWLERIKTYTYDRCEKHTVVFMGYLVEKQGVQLILNAIPEIVKRLPNFHFKIIGDGGYKHSLELLAKQKKIMKYCTFYGKIDDIQTVENQIAKSALAVAPYIRELDTWTYYADPGKVKTYLACGVPVLLTNLPWNAKDIEKKSCGQIISEDVDEIVKMIIKNLEAKRNAKFRENARKYAEQFDYTNIFSSLSL